jgi:glycerol-3-phosphate cytidylyltransferase-like family protein
MSIKERKAILQAIKYVDKVFVSIDKDRSVSRSLEKIRPNIFAVGADNYKENLLEKEICDKLGIKIIDRLTKKIIINPLMKQSSSKIIKKYLEKHKCTCGMI